MIDHPPCKSAQENTYLLSFLKAFVSKKYFHLMFEGFFFLSTSLQPSYNTCLKWLYLSLSLEPQLYQNQIRLIFQFQNLQGVTPSCHTQVCFQPTTSDDDLNSIIKCRTVQSYVWTISCLVMVYSMAIRVVQFSNGIYQIKVKIL